MVQTRGGGSVRGRLLLALLLVALVAYAPLWLHCSLRPAPSPPQVVYVPAKALPATTKCDCDKDRHRAAEATARPTDSRRAVGLSPTPVPNANGRVRPAHSPYHIHIVVFTYRRIEGLRRLLASLGGSNYGGDDVTLTIFLDYPKKGASLTDDGTRALVASFRWPHGRLNVHRRLANAGLKRTIMEAWFPPGDDSEAAAFFEDDIEVSPHWYMWSAAALRKYAMPGGMDAAVEESLLGVSLFRPIHDELSGKGCVVKNDNQAFALQQPCSWGAIYLPKPWRAFRNWYDEYTAVGDKDPQVVLEDGSEPSSNGWGKAQSWKKYLIKLMAARGWFMVYPNPPMRTVLATNHLMRGEHPTPPKPLFELPLLGAAPGSLEAFVGRDAVAEPAEPAAVAVDWTSFDRTLPALDKMWFYDLMFRRVAGGRPKLPREMA